MRRWIFAHWKMILLAIIFVSSIAANVAVLIGWTTNDTLELPNFLYTKLLEILASPMEFAKLLLDSAFFTALFGAGFGALSSYLFAVRSKRIEDTAEELKYVNEGIENSGHIANTAIGYMKQQIGPLKTRFDSDLARVEDFVNRKNLGQMEPGEQFHVEMDLRSLPKFSVSAAMLAKMSEHITTEGNTMLMARTLIQSVDQLNELILARNNYVEETKNLNGLTHEQKILRFFGIPHEGIIERRNRDISEGLFLVNQDCIWFGIKVCEALTTHGKKVRAGRKKFGAIKAFGFAKSAQFIPPDENYKDWLS